MMVGIGLFIRIFPHTFLNGNIDEFLFEKLCLKMAQSLFGHLKIHKTIRMT
jgi:hypothetical protein